MRLQLYLKHTLIYLILLIWPYSTSADTFKSNVRFVDSGGSWPLVIEDDDGIRGFLPESVSALFDSLDISTELRLVPDVRIFHELLQNRADVSTAVFGYDDIQKADYPSSLSICPEPIHIIDVHAVWHKDAGIDPTKEYDLDNYRVGVVKLAPKGNSPIPKNDQSSNKVSFRTLELMIKSLLAKRVDVILMNGGHAKAMVKRLTYEDKFQQGQFIMSMPIHLVLADHWLKPGKSMDIVCNRIVELKQQRVFQSIYDSYLVKAFVD